jgi:hypothetical protein
VRLAFVAAEKAPYPVRLLCLAARTTGVEESGRKVSRKRVARRMRHQDLAGRRRRHLQRTTHSNHPFPVAPHMLIRELQVEAPNVACPDAPPLRLTALVGRGQAASLELELMIRTAPHALGA